MAQASTPTTYVYSDVIRLFSRELRIAISKPGADSNTTSSNTTTNITNTTTTNATSSVPQSPTAGSIAELPELATWQQFSSNQTGPYQASPPAFVPGNGG